MEDNSKKELKTELEENNDIIVGDGEEPVTPESEAKKTKKVHVLAGISFTLLNVEFTAGFEKDDKGFQVLLLPTNQSENNGMSISEMITEIQSLMNNSGAQIEGGKEQMEEDITNALNGVNSPDKKPGEDSKADFKPLELRVYLKQAFLYYKKAGENKTFEYAFQMEINTENMMPDIGLVKLDKLSISVWSTERKKILESMGLFHIDEILQKYV